MRYWKYYLRILIPLFGIMAATTIILIIVSCLPGIISRAIGRFTFARQALDIDDYGRNNKNLIRKIEWIRFYPLKKLILFLLWLFCLFISVTASYVYLFAFRIYDSEDVVYLTLFYILTAATFFPIMKYIVRSYHCMPYLNKILPEREIDSLMEREKFQQVLLSEEYLDTYVPIYQSADWLVVRGTVISRKLTVMAHLNYGYSSDKRHPHTWLEIYYVNGKKIKIDLGPGIDDYMGVSYRRTRGKLLEDFVSKETVRLEGFRNGERDEKLVSLIVEKYDKLLPEARSESEKILSLLKSDMTEIKQEIFSDEQIKRLV